MRLARSNQAKYRHQGGGGSIYIYIYSMSIYVYVYICLLYPGLRTNAATRVIFGCQNEPNTTCGKDRFTEKALPLRSLEVSNSEQTLFLGFISVMFKPISALHKHRHSVPFGVVLRQARRTHHFGDSFLRHIYFQHKAHDSW